MKKLTLVLCTLAFLGGCNYLSYLLYLGSPNIPKTEEAEFKGLPNKTVAVVVYADPRVLYDYNYLREQISGAVGYHLEKNVSNVKIVPVERVSRFQNGTPDWETVDKTVLGKKFSADYVLYITISDFTTLEPGSSVLHRGYLTAQVALYQSDLPEKQACAWTAGEIHVVYPEHEGGQLMTDDRQLQNETVKAFAELLAKKFYKHKIADEDESEKDTPPS